MNKLNKKGFTLIELLAVIVILAVVLGIAIPAVSQYITKSRKNGYVDNLLQFVDAARKGATLGDDYSLPVDNNHATVVKFSTLAVALEKGGSESSYGNPWVRGDEKDESGNLLGVGSFVVIVNSNTADSPKYDYYVVASDGKYVTGVSSETSPSILLESSLKAENIVRKDSNGPSIPTAGGKLCLNGNVLTPGDCTSGGTAITVDEVK